jgi:hypothetical protein
MNIFYLHGFGSSPGSNKARQLAERFAAHGISLRVPDLNVPDFEHLTLTAMLRRVAAEVNACPPGPVHLIGSSLGGLVALHFADTYRATEGSRVAKLALLAPALDFLGNRDAELIDGWREQGQWDWFNYAEGREVPVHYGLVEDVARYDSYTVSTETPTLIIHGEHDESVPVEDSRRFAADRPHVDLRVVDSDHQLLDQVEYIWQSLVQFFDVPG